jgi:16S rRNA processing protein RimM
MEGQGGRNGRVPGVTEDKLIAAKLVAVAQVAGAFGVKGEAKIRSFTEDPEACFSFGPLLDEAGNTILTPIRHRPLGDLFGVTAKESRQREEWEAMKGALLHVPREAMPAADENEIYVSDLIGMDVVHTDGRVLGKVKSAQNFGAGDLIEISPPAGDSYYLPFTEETFPEIDVAARRLVATPDEELLPENLQPPKPDAPSA